MGERGAGGGIRSAFPCSIIRVYFVFLFTGLRVDTLLRWCSSISYAYEILVFTLKQVDVEVPGTRYKRSKQDGGGLCRPHPPLPINTNTRDYCTTHNRPKPPNMFTLDCGSEESCYTDVHARPHHRCTAHVTISVCEITRG